MALRRSIRAGNEITLRARMTDDLGDAALASGVQINLYKPEDEIPFVTGSPTYWDEGIFEFSYTVPEDGPDGLWSDEWLAELNGETLSGLFTFEVSASGDILPLDGQLNFNNILDITIPSGIMATDGSVLEEDYEFTFSTSISPGYTDANKVMLEVGGVLGDLTEDIVYMAILEASLEADALTFSKIDQNTELYRHARREWTTCKAGAIIGSNVRSKFYAKAKRLGDLEVEYDPYALDDLLDRIVSCLDRWEPQLQTGGYATQTPVGVIKGEHDPDRPSIGRGWFSEGTDAVSRRIPAANTKLKPRNKRRWAKGFKNRWNK